MLAAEAQMDKERGGGGGAKEQKRGASASRVPLARRQHKLLSSVHLSGCNGKRHNLSGPVTGSGDDTGDGSSPRDGWKKEKPASESGGSSSNDDGGGMVSGRPCRSGDGDKEPCTPPIASTSTSKKRAKLNGKVLDGYGGVDPAVVPRKLRSAMTKRVSGSLSPSLLDGRKKHHLANNGGNSPSSRAIVEVAGSLTKDEEDAVQTLSVLALMVTDNTKPAQVCADVMPSSEKSESKPSTSGNIGGSTEDLFCSEKLLEEPEMPVPLTEPDMPKQASPVVQEECPRLDLELNQPPQVDITGFDLMKMDSNVDLNDAADLSASDSVEPVPQLFLGSGVVEPPKKLASPQKPDAPPALGLMEYSPGTLSLDVKCQAKTEHAVHLTCGEGMRIALPVPAGGRPDVACRSSEPCPSTTGTPAEKMQTCYSDRRQTWKKCATHVYIGYLIRHCQATDRESHMPMTCKRPKLEPISVINEVSKIQNGMRSLPAKETDDCHKPLEMKTETVQDKRPKPVQQLQNMHGVYIQPKQNCDLMMMPAGPEFPNPGSKMDSAAKLSPPTNLTSMAPHHSVVSFSLHPPYSSPYPDQLAAAAAAAQQMQLQLPPQYLANPFFGFHIGHMGGPAAKQQMQHPQQPQHQQQQQLLQAHVTQYRMPPVLPKWQNGRPLDPSQALLPYAQMQPVILHHPAVEGKGAVASHHRPTTLQHQMLPIPLQAANRSK